MWAVPVFLMVTGALLFNSKKEITIKKIWSKYILRVFVALVVFGFLYNLFDIVTQGQDLTFESLLNGFAEVYFGTSWSHLWYLYLIIAIYILLPFYKKIANQMSKKEYIYLFIVFLIFVSLANFLSNIEFKPAFYICVSSIYPCYLFVGHYINLYAKNSKMSILYFFIMTIILAVISYLRYKLQVEWLDYAIVYSSALVFFQAWFIFKSLMSIKDKKVSIVKKVLLKIDYCTFGMYLVHMFVIRFAVKNLHLNAITEPINFVLIILASIVISYILVFAFKHVANIEKIKFWR